MFEPEKIQNPMLHAFVDIFGNIFIINDYNKKNFDTVKMEISINIKN